MSILNNNRGTGRTTAQMNALPLGSVFVWCNSHIDYPRRLAEKLGRSDLEIVPPTWVVDGCWYGRKLVGFDIDHAYEGQAWDWLPELQSRVR